MTRRAVFGDLLGASRQDHLVDLLREVETWHDSVGAVPNFSSAVGVAGAQPPTPDEEAARLAAVLGAVPHPTAFRLREAPYLYEDIAAEWAEQHAQMETLINQTNQRLWLDTYENAEKDAIDNGTIDDQDGGLVHLRDAADRISKDNAFSVADQASAAALRDFIDGVTWPLTTAHRIRAETRDDSTFITSWKDAFTGAHLPTPDDPQLWYVRYGADGAAADGTFPALQLVPDGTPRAIAASLRGYAADARHASSLPRPGYPHSAAASLLEKLVQHAVENVDATQTEELALGLEGLATMLDDPLVTDRRGELERLLRETLGLATHRYDAWATSLANQRLATLRSDRPTGIQVGGYGWLVKLVPDVGGGADSRGFVHAPSIDHAVTAAVLRSAWLEYADSAADAPFGVDLSSERVRRASWLLDGVRNGVDLAELLGARVERRLHDSGLSHLITEVRERVAAASGVGTLPAGAIVDGLAVAVAYSESTTSDPVRASLDELRATLPGFPGDRLLPQLHGAVVDLDSTTDVLTAQAVHSVTKGNLAEAAATLSAAGAGAAGVPQLRLPSVHRDAQIVSHRIVAVLHTPPAATTSVPSLLTIAEPALAGWLRAVLPELDGVVVSTRVGEAGGWQSTLADAGLSAVEVVSLAASGGDLPASRLGVLLVARARYETGAAGDAPVVFGGTDQGTVPLADVAVVAGALRSAVGSARALGGGDLTDSTDAVPAVDVADLDTRRLSLAAALDDLAGQQPAETLLVDRLADLAALDPEGLAAALSQPEQRSEAVVALLERAARAAEGLRSPLPDGYPTLPAQGQADLQVGRIRAALALSVPILPRHTPADAVALGAAFAATPGVVGEPVVALSWLLEAGKVHQGAGTCSDAIDLVETIRPDAPARLQVAQLPRVPGEPWVAREEPLGPGRRLSILSITDAAAALGRGPVSGLVFDAWSEPLPGRVATTGLAVHFDRPGAQPPQAVLLLAPPEEGSWTVDEIETQLRQTLDLAQIRAVGPETLNSWGHTLPAVFLPEGTAVTETATAGAAGTPRRPAWPRT